ncbi:MAG: copper resistance CopC family protein [Acidimicrobiales bacterium]
MTRRAVAVLVAVLVGLVPAVASADAVFIGSSPAPQAIVGGTVDTLEVVFNEIVSMARLTIEGPDGTVEVKNQVTEGQVISVTFDELSAEGRYLVRYSVISADTDPVEGAFSFTYQMDGPAPLPVVAPALDTGSVSTAPFVVAILVGLAGVLCVQIIRRSRRLRQLKSSEGVRSER